MRAKSKKETEQTLSDRPHNILQHGMGFQAQQMQNVVFTTAGKPTTNALIKWSSSSTARRSNGSAPTISRHKTRPETLIKRTSNTYITKNSQPRQSDPQSKRTKAKKPSRHQPHNLQVPYPLHHRLCLHPANIIDPTNSQQSSNNSEQHLRNRQTFSTKNQHIRNPRHSQTKYANSRLNHPLLTKNTK